MISSFQKWDKIQKDWHNGPVIYLSSTDASLLREAEKFVLQRWKEQRRETPTQLDGPVPDFGELIAATGAISLFGGVRHVLLRELVPSSMSDKEAKELEVLFADLENAVLLVTAHHKDKRLASTKKAKSLSEAAKSHGFYVELTEPTRQENLAFLREVAAACGGTTFTNGAAEDLLERVKENRVLLKNETEKLAAIAGYQQIDSAMVQRYSVRNVEADVFELLRLIADGRKAEVQVKLAELFALKSEPVAIVAALGGSFVDMLRVRVGAENGCGPTTVFSDMHYTGSDYRLKKAKDNAKAYTTQALKQAVCMLTKLDKTLKSTAVSNKTIFVQAAVAELFLLRGRG